jgi:hypothetical protein
MNCFPAAHMRKGYMRDAIPFGDTLAVIWNSIDRKKPEKWGHKSAMQNPRIFTLLIDRFFAFLEL